jgi:uncharacterized OB-fold protein
MSPDASLPARLDYDAWRQYLNDEVLLGQRCPECDHVSARPRSVCLECNAADLETIELPTDGVVHSETSIEVTPDGFDESGYRVGIVDLGEAKLLARLEGEPAIGDDVSLVGVLTESDDPAPIFE